MCIWKTSWGPGDDLLLASGYDLSLKGAEAVIDFIPWIIHCLTCQKLLIHQHAPYMCWIHWVTIVPAAKHNYAPWTWGPIYPTPSLFCHFKVVCLCFVYFLSDRATLDARCFCIGFYMTGNVKVKMRVSEGTPSLGVKPVRVLYDTMGWRIEGKGLPNPKPVSRPPPRAWPR